MHEKIVSHANNVKMEEVERANNINIQWLIGEDKDVNYYMRRFTLEANGKMVHHRHDNFEHQEYVLEGRIRVDVGDEVYELEKGNFAYIPKGAEHSYKNIGEGRARFLCIIPSVDNRHTEILED